MKFQITNNKKLAKKYHQGYDGDDYRFTLPARIYIACCDCGLVHSYVFSKSGKAVKFIVKRESRATGQLRRRHFKGFKSCRSD